MSTILVFAGTSRPVPLPYPAVLEEGTHNDLCTLCDCSEPSVVFPEGLVWFYKQVGNWHYRVPFDMELITEADFMARQEANDA